MYDYYMIVWFDNDIIKKSRENHGSLASLILPRGGREWHVKITEVWRV